MGQYYYPINVKTKEYVYSHDFGSGLKLMEHSWMKNDFVKFVESLLAEGGAWHGQPICWAGDYADPEKDENGEVMRHTYEGKEYDTNLHDLAENKIAPNEAKKFRGKHYRYLINEDRKEFVDKTKVPDMDGWSIHPLPLLTCEGNGRGGGDFGGEGNENLIGLWTRNVIVPSTKKPKGYTEVIFDLYE